MKRILPAILALTLAVGLCACGAKNTSAPDSAGALEQHSLSSKVMDGSMSGTADGGTEEWGESSPTATDVSSLEERKVIKRASFTMQAKDFPAAMDMLNARISTTGSYIENSESWGEVDKGNRSVSMTIRVPVGQYEAFKAGMPKIGNVVGSSESGEDVTAQYFDTDARLTALRTQETRLLELMEQANTMEDILAIEDKLMNVRLQIEQLTTTMERLDGLISYAAITVNLEQTKDYIVPDDSFGSQLWQTVKDSMNGLLDVGKNIVFVFIWALPYLIIALAVFLTVRSRLRKRRAKAVVTDAQAVNTEDSENKPE